MKYLDVPSSGSIADRTHSHNRAGQYTRNRRSPVQPTGSGRRGFIRAAFGASSTAWAGLTSEQRGSWDSFAALHPTVDALGQSIVLTGHQMFVAVATQRQNTAQTIPSTPPANTSLPAVGACTLVASVAAGITVDGFTVESTGFVACAFSPLMSAGRSFNSRYWQPLGADGFIDADSPPYELATAVYAAEFGTPVTGYKLFARVTPVSTTGWFGAPVILQAVWAA